MFSFLKLKLLRLAPLPRTLLLRTLLLRTLLLRTLLLRTLLLGDLPLRLVTVFLLCLSLGACANIANYPGPRQAPAQVEDRSVADKVVVDGQVLALPDQGSIHAEELPSQVKVSPVVQQLLVSAEQQRSEGDSSAAANSLERALRIEPRNAILWSRLADIRFAQSNWQQAIQMAAKSNTLTGNDQQLRRRNWYLMANSYSALDNLIQAQKYRDKLSSTD